MSNVVVMTTGGTIATVRNAATGELEVLLSGRELVEQTADLGISISIEELFRLASSELTVDHVMALCRVINGAIQGECKGIVVTHGTATLEEVAFFVSLVVSTAKPIVFTGAMRDATQKDADGPRNLRDAVRVAAADLSAGRGVLVVMDGDIMDARSAVKKHANKLSAFGVRFGGPEGVVTDAGIAYFSGPRPSRLRFAASRVERRVELIRTCFDPDPAMIQSAVDRGVRGIVIEGMGSDGIPPALKDPLLGALAGGRAVAVSTRSAGGFSTPEHPVAQELARMGAVFTRYLDGLKARIVLMLALGESPDRDDLQGIFDLISGGQFN